MSRAGLAGLAAAAVPNPAIGAAVGLGAVLLVTGAHHLDGLLDLGDGLMAHGGTRGPRAARSSTGRSARAAWPSA